MNPVVIAVLLMLILSMLRINVVVSLAVSAIVGGLVGGLSLMDTLKAFTDGLGGGATIALSYAMLGAFAVAISRSGITDLLAHKVISQLGGEANPSQLRWVKALLLGALLLVSISSQNLIPVHIAFIPILVPPLLHVMAQMKLDRRLAACVITFGLVTTYMYIPMGFGRVFLYDILYANIEKSGLDVSNVPVMGAMGIPALGMLVGLLIAVFVTYRKPRTYLVTEVTDSKAPKEIHKYRIVVAVAAIIACVLLQTILTLSESAADPLLIGSLTGLVIFVASGAVKWKDADAVFSGGMRMMAMIGLIMITAQGYAVRDFLVAHAKEFHVDHIIYRQQIWTPYNPTWRHMADRGSPTANHMDHVHVAVDNA